MKNEMLGVEISQSPQGGLVQKGQPPKFALRNQKQQFALRNNLQEYEPSCSRSKKPLRINGPLCSLQQLTSTFCFRSLQWNSPKKTSNFFIYLSWATSIGRWGVLRSLETHDFMHQPIQFLVFSGAICQLFFSVLIFPNHHARGMFFPWCDLH